MACNACVPLRACVRVSVINDRRASILQLVSSLQQCRNQWRKGNDLGNQGERCFHSAGVELTRAQEICKRLQKDTALDSRDGNVWKFLILALYSGLNGPASDKMGMKKKFKRQNDVLTKLESKFAIKDDYEGTGRFKK